MAWAYRTGSYATTGTYDNWTTAPTKALGAAVSAGDRIVVAVLAFNVGGTSPFPTVTVTDSVNAGNYQEDATLTWTELGVAARFSVFSKGNSGAGTPTVTATQTNGGVSNSNVHGGLQVAAWSGLSTADDGTGVDKTAIATGTAATASSGATATTTAANELAVGAYVDLGEGTTITADAAFTLRGKHDGDGVSFQGLLEDKDSGSSGSAITATAGTGEGSSNGWGQAAVVYKLAGGAAQDTPELRGRPFGLRGQVQMNQLLAQ